MLLCFLREGLYIPCNICVLVLMSPGQQVCDCQSTHRVSIAQWLKRWHSMLEALIGFEFHLRLDFSPPIALIFQVNVIMNPQINGCNLNKI